MMLRLSLAASALLVLGSSGLARADVAYSYEVENADRHAPGKGPILISTAIDEGGAFVVSLIESKEQIELATNKWGHEPLRNITQGHYGLGLNRARLNSG